MTDPKLLPRRIVVATSGQRAIVLQGNMRAADEILRADADVLLALGYDEFISIQPARRRIQFASGGVINYIGGRQEVLEQRLRGTQAAYVDGAELVHPGLIAVITRS